MKPSPQYDFPVRVRLQTWEYERQESRFYRGVINAILNHQIRIMFVPEVKIDSDSLSVLLPNDVDNVSNENEARLDSIAISDYVVTPNSERAGKEQIIINDFLDEPRAIIIFYVTSQEFKIFSSELHKLAQKTPAVHSSVKVSEIEHLEVIKFLHSRIISSQYLTEYDLEMLGRTKTGWYSTGTREPRQLPYPVS